MARSHSHAVKIGEGRKARRRKRKKNVVPAALVMNVEFALAWVCNDASCTAPHGASA